MSVTVHVEDTSSDDNRWRNHLREYPTASFHQSDRWYDHIGALDLNRRAMLVMDGPRIAASALLSGHANAWTLWQGPVGAPNKEILDMLIDQLTPDQPTVLVISPDWDSLAIQHPRLASDGEYVTHLLTLDGGSDDFMRRMRPTTRNRVRRARRAGVAVHEGGCHESEFFDLYRSEMRRIQSPDEATWAELHDLLDQRDCRLFTAWLGGELAAGAIALDYNGTLELRYVATARSARAVAPMNLLYFEVMLWGAGNGRQWLDVSGIATGGLLNDRTAALNRFKAGFGHDVRLVCPRYRFLEEAPRVTAR